MKRDYMVPDKKIDEFFMLGFDELHAGGRINCFEFDDRCSRE